MSDNIEFGSLDERVRGVPLLGGLLAGIISFVGGYLSFLGIAAGTGEGLDFEGQSFRQVGQFFYNSFLVPTHQRTSQVLENEVDGETVLQEVVFDVRHNPFYESDDIAVESRTYLDGALFEEESRTIPVESADGFILPELTFPDLFYLAVPVVILMGVGFAFAYLFVSLEGVASWSDVLVRGAIGGGTITLGFVLLALLGSHLFVIDEVALFTAQEGEGTFTRPDRVDTLLFGLAYPAIFSTVGILLGQLAHRPEVTDSQQDDVTVAAGEQATPDDVQATPTDEQTTPADDVAEGATEETTRDPSEQQATHVPTEEDAIDTTDSQKPSGE